MTRARANATIAASATLGLAAVAWLIAFRRMHRMDMGGTTELGSFTFFGALWLTMMAAMMLPGTIPALSKRAYAGGRLLTMPLFVGSYLVIWTLVGVAVYAVYRPPGPAAAGAIVIAAGLYELTPLKRRCRTCCRETVRSGSRFGIYCVGSSIGLMLMLVALGIMSIAWMIVIGVLVLIQKLLPSNPAIDIPVAIAIVALGVLILVAPATVPGSAIPM